MPLASSIIADYFDVQQRALALGFYNWGIYIGYSMSFAVGNFVTLSLVLFTFCFSYFKIKLLNSFTLNYLAALIDLPTFSWLCDRLTWV